VTDYEDTRTDEERYNDRCNEADDSRNAARSRVTLQPYADNNHSAPPSKPSSDHQLLLPPLQDEGEDTNRRKGDSQGMPEGGTRGLWTLPTLAAALTTLGYIGIIVMILNNN